MRAEEMREGARTSHPRESRASAAEGRGRGVKGGPAGRRMHTDDMNANRSNRWGRVGAPALMVTLLSLVGSVAPQRADAQRRFNELAADASEVTGSLVDVVAPLFEDCAGTTGRARRECLVNLRGERRRFAGETYLVSLSAADLLRIGDYEPMDGGFRVTLRHFAFATDEHVVATTRTEGGRAPDAVVATGFATVPARAARPWLLRNSLDRLVLRVIVSVGEGFRDGERRGLTLNLVAAQVFNESTGEVPLDTTRRPNPPPAPHVLNRRVRLWDRNGEAQALWTAPDGQTYLFHVHNEPLVNPPNSSAPVLHVWHGAERETVVQFVAPCCDANVSVAPRQADTITVIITERAPHGNTPGHGQVLVIRHVPEEHAFIVLARWRGSNTETPPAWVTDPTAPVPTHMDAVTPE